MAKKKAMTMYRVFRKGRGNPIKGMRLVIVHDCTVLVGNKVVSHRGKTAHFTPNYSTRDPEVIKFLDEKCDDSPHYGIWYENVTKAQEQVNDMICGDEQVRDLIDILGAVDAEKLAKKKYKKKLTELSRFEAYKLIQQSMPVEVEDPSEIAKKVSEHKQIRDGMPLGVKGAEVLLS